MLVARPRTLGPTVSFRLPIDLHVVADQRARLHGMTVTEYLQSRIVEALRRSNEHEAPSATGGESPPPTEPRKVTTYFKNEPKGRKTA